MGRFVSSVEGFDWTWKFWFGQQCSNFGAVMELANGDDVSVSRYIGDDGEYVSLNAEKTKLLENLRKLQINECPVCKGSECLEATRAMVESFTKAVAKQNDEEIYALFFAEY
jgi:hypothetical protein